MLGLLGLSCEVTVVLLHELALQRLLDRCCCMAYRKFELWQDPPCTASELSPAGLIGHADTPLPYAMLYPAVTSGVRPSKSELGFEQDIGSQKTLLLVD